MLPRDEPAAPDMTPRNRGERRAAARATVKRTKRPRVGTLDAFRALSVAPLDAKQPQRAQPPVALPAGHISRQVRRAHARAMRAAIDAGTVAAPWRSQRVSVDCRVTSVGR